MTIPLVTLTRLKVSKAKLACFRHLLAYLYTSVVDPPVRTTEVKMRKMICDTWGRRVSFAALTVSFDSHTTLHSEE
jgi:hypothetical protein